jgi:hypothetical protein
MVMLWVRTYFNRYWIGSKPLNQILQVIDKKKELTRIDASDLLHAIAIIVH